MRYPDNVVQDVINLNDIADVVSGYVQLTPRSGNLFGLCPFHKEKTPSFSVSPQKQIFYCFGCGAGGHVISFITRIENLDFISALKLLADRARYQLPEQNETKDAKENRKLRETIAELNKNAARFYHDYLFGGTQDAKYALKYLKKRGVEPHLIKRFGIGLSPPGWDNLIKHMANTKAEQLAIAGLVTQNRKDATQYYDRFRARLMFPIIDIRNRVVGFGGRIMDDNSKEAKYLNTPETALFHKSNNLYGLNLARKAHSQELIIVEGYMDVLAMHKGGFVNTVGVLGTALNDAHTRLLKNASCQSVILMLDSDNAGVRATLRAIPVLNKAGIKVKTLDLSKGEKKAKDPDDFLAIYGTAPLKALLAESKSHVAFQISLLKDNHNLTTTEGRVDFTKEAAKLLAGLSSAIETDAYVADISNETDISPTAIVTEIKKQQGQDPTVIYRTPKRNFRAPNAERGIQKAKETLLYIVLTSAAAAKALKKSEYICKEELGEGLYYNLLEFAYTSAEENRDLSATEVIAAFSDNEREVTEIFIDQPYYSNKDIVQKVLNETAFILKRAWALSKMTDPANTAETMQTLGFAARNMPTLCI